MFSLICSLYYSEIESLNTRFVQYIVKGKSYGCSNSYWTRSDGDVVLHALSDALLGALALGDIGQHFPDTDPEYKGADSRILLKHVYQLILDRGYHLNNADITVACERPKLAKHNLEMRQSIADVLEVDITQISIKATTTEQLSIKATTTEQLGFTGRQEGILATATVLISHQAR